MLDRAVANCAGVYRVWAERMGKRSRLWDDLSCADLELPVALPPNIPVVLREPSRDEADTLPQRAAEFFGERTGGPYGVWSLWPIKGLPPLLVGPRQHPSSESARSQDVGGCPTPTDIAHPTLDSGI
jgi:hypothetical protein